MLRPAPQKAPSSTLIKEETEHLLLCFCTFCSSLKGKKLSLQNIFILVLQEKKLRNILKELLTIETNFDVVKLFYNQIEVYYKIS